MASYNIKHIEYLRQKANLTYEQAVALLERNDGDIGKALVELEKNGALRGQPAASSQSERAYDERRAPENPPRQRSFWDNLVDLFIKGLRLKLVVDKNREVLVRLPVLYLLVAMFMAPHLALLSVVLMFLTGCRVHIEHASDPEGDRKIRDYARGAEQTVRSRMGGTQRQERTPYNAPRNDGKSSGDNDDDFDSFTVE
ncbi:MAG: DUF4342 domain-containing protein [Candidatus Fimadaptatus sp.]|jgi:hypothetical protein